MEALETAESKVAALHSQIWIPRPPDDVFRFFADAGNLDLLTPAWLHFRIVTPRPIAIREGAEIDYRLRIRGIPVSWRSRITLWDPPHAFTDEQVRGPYKKWIHEHLFHAVDGGTRVEDRLDYSVWGGRLIDRILVAPDLSRIFEFRRKQLVELFAV